VLAVHGILVSDQALARRRYHEPVVELHRHERGNMNRLGAAVPPISGREPIGGGEPVVMSLAESAVYFRQNGFDTALAVVAIEK